jgi:hypothetical protein
MDEREVLQLIAKMNRVNLATLIAYAIGFGYIYFKK